MTSSEHEGGKSMDVVLRCEQLLERWSLAEPDAAFFDANHDAVMARIGLLKPGVRSSEDALLEAPLPQVPGEPAALLTPALSPDAPLMESREKGGSLRELAERALGGAEGGAADGRENEAERTSAVHLAFGGHRRGLALGDGNEPSERASVVPFRSFAGEAAQGGAVLERAPEQAAPTAAISVAPRGAEAPRTLKERWPMAVTAFSAAAGFLLWWSLERANHSPMAAAPSVALEVGAVPATGAPQVADGPVGERGAAAPMAASEPTETPPNAGATEHDEAVRRIGTGVAMAPGAARTPATAGGDAEHEELAQAGAGSAEVVPEEVVLEEEEEAPAKTNERGESLIQDDPRLRPAAEQTPVVQQPAVGAVQGAFGQVLPGARACVVGQAAPSRATVTFGSDGSVSSVVVEGPAKGTPADACIQRALGRARLAPFAKPSFSATTTVRP